jgi:hypothetical protein
MSLPRVSPFFGFAHFHAVRAAVEGLRELALRAARGKEKA